MSDVVIIGGGTIGRELAHRCEREGLNVTVVEAEENQPLDWQGTWLKGRGVMSGRGLVAILDPATGDERRLLQACAVVWAVGAFDPAQPSSRMLGVTKLGVELSVNGTSMVTDSNGRTRAEGIYGTGRCASVETPGLVENLVSYCKSSLPKS